MSDSEEVERLKALYTQLRDRLLDLSSRNPLISFKHRSSSKRQLRFVETTLEGAYKRIAGAGVSIKPVPEPDDIPADEATEEFKAELEHLRATDETYLADLKEAQASSEEDSPIIARAERLLRKAARELLELPPRPSLRDTSPKDHAQSLGINTSWELPKSGAEIVEPRSLQAIQWPDPLDAILDRLAEDARLAEQEMGMSTLFCVFGFLDWYEADSSDKVVTSPLLLFPVKIEVKRQPGTKSIFQLKGSEEPLDTNLSLRKRLERDFKIDLPELQPTSDDDEAEYSVERYLDAVEQTIASQPRWKVRRQITLGHFKFGRLAMYSELDPANWAGGHPVTNRLIRAVLAGTEVSGDGGESLSAYPEDYPIDKSEFESVAPFLIQNADASQHSAMIDVMKGENLVIQGPPGTGKSQTITNVIANLIGQGKTVLFLADKLAALEVVKRRMDSAGLGEFCLELHSDKASARHVVESLKNRVALKTDVVRQYSNHATLTEGHQEIVDYLDALHSETASGDTPFEVFWKALRANSGPDGFAQSARLSIPERLLTQPESVKTARRLTGLYGHMLASFEGQHGRLQQSPWRSIDFGGGTARGSAPLANEQIRLLHIEARDHAAAVAALKPYGSIDPAEYEGLIEQLRAINAESPKVSALSLAREHDPVLLQRAAVLTTQLLDIKLQQQGQPDLRSYTEAHIEAIQRLHALQLEFGQGDASAGKFKDELFANTGSLKELAGLLDQLQPAIVAAGLHDSTPSRSLLILAAVLQRLVKVDASLRQWALRLNASNALDLTVIHKRWKTLVAAEAQLRGRFPSARQWPSTQLVEQVRKTLTKGAISRFVGSISGDRKAVEALAENLGIVAAEMPSSDELGDLAKHFASVAQFNADRRISELFGASARGLDTPIATYVEAAACSADINKVIAADDDMAWLRDELRTLVDEEINLLISHRRMFVQLETKPRHVLQHLGEQSLAEVRSAAQRHADAVAFLTGLELPNGFRESATPVASFAKAVAAEKQLRSIAAELRGLPSGLTQLLLSSPNSAGDLGAAAAWIIAVTQRRLPSALEAALLCQPEVRDRLVSALTTARDTTAAVVTRADST